MPKCRSCGHDNPPDVELCRNCSASLPKAAPADQAAAPDVIRSLLAQGHKIEAIKLYREQTGAGLKEAKDAVEALQRGQSISALEAAGEAWKTEVLSLLLAPRSR